MMLQGMWRYSVFRLLILVASLLITTNAFAVNMVCFEQGTNNTQRRLQGDCYKKGVCQGYNNTNILPNCIIATQEEYNKASDRFTEYDANVVSGSRIVDMSTQKKQAILDAEALAQVNAQKQSIDNFDITAKDVMTAYVKVYNSKVPVAYRVTKQEIIDQIKLDLGL